MPVPPKPPHLQAPAALAEHGRKINRLEGDRDQMASTLAKHGQQIATASSKATAAKTEADGISNRIGSADFSFLQGLSEMPDIAGIGGSSSRSGIGTISGTPTAAEYNALNTAYNNTSDLVNTLVSKVNSLLAELKAAGAMH